MTWHVDLSAHEASDAHTGQRMVIHDTIRCYIVDPNSGAWPSVPAVCDIRNLNDPGDGLDLQVPRFT